VIDLKSRFQKVWENSATDNSATNTSEIFDQLIAMYSESWRSYHNISHIEACLKYFDSCRDQADSEEAIELAIWFHDCIYVVRASNNEARSRDWFLERSNGILSDSLRNSVDELIMDTCHRTEPETEDGKLLADIDLTSFGLPWKQYLADGENVQHEFNYGDNGAITGNKSGFLKYLASRQSIYYSPYYLKHFEKPAQNNIATHLEILKDEEQL